MGCLLSSCLPPSSCLQELKEFFDCCSPSIDAKGSSSFTPKIAELTFTSEKTPKNDHESQATMTVSLDIPFYESAAFAKLLADEPPPHLNNVRRAKSGKNGAEVMVYSLTFSIVKCYVPLLSYVNMRFGTHVDRVVIDCDRASSFFIFASVMDWFEFDQMRVAIDTLTDVSFPILLRIIAKHEVKQLSLSVGHNATSNSETVIRHRLSSVVEQLTIEKFGDANANPHAYFFEAPDLE